MSRTINTVRNIRYAIIGQTFGLVISFLARMVFVRTLGAEYLGLNGLFSNILSMLSLADLGIGSAIIYSLYKPLAEKNEPKIQALMALFKRAYISIGIIIFVLGFSITPFLPYLVDKMPDIPHINLIYMMFVADAAISYFFSYKRSLIIADQKRYIATLYRYGFYFVLNSAQIIILLTTGNFILFLLLQILNTSLENIFISRRANKIYPFLTKRDHEKLHAEEKKSISRNVKAMIGHKIGGVVVLGTDNIILSKFVGLVTVGLYSNYLLITGALNTILGLIFEAATASIGNLGVTETKERSHFIFRCVDIFGFWIYSFSSICLFILLNPFIKIWLGEQYLFSISLVSVIVVNFYLEGMRKSVLSFRDAYGLYWYDRYKPFFSAGINLIVSILLVIYIGTIGVFIGTAVSILTTCFWVEPYILHKYVFKISSVKYFQIYVLRTVLFLCTGILTWFLCSLIGEEGIINFLGKVLVCIIIPNLIYLILFWHKDEFKHLLLIVRKWTSIADNQP